MPPINLLNFMFVIFTIFIVIFGGLINLVEPYLPVFIKQSFRYGKMSYHGDQCKYTRLLETPKSWFKHFYNFAIIWSGGAALLAVRSYLLDAGSPPLLVVQFLDFVTGSSERSVQVQSTTCLVGVALITLQCARRCYETNFVQIFSAHSKINVLHYLLGYLHYFATITGIVANAEGFVGGSTAHSAKFSDLTIIQLVAIVVFIYSWLQQFLSNLILVNLRKNKSGHVVTQKHLMPEGGWFESVSSPHMFFEVMMYMALFALMPGCVTIRYAAFWVLSNQIESAWLNHKWYQQTFGSKYPKKRRAIFPGIL